MSVLAYLFLIAICILIQAFFAAIEIALLSCNPIQIRYLANRRHWMALVVDRFLKEPVGFLSTTMIGVNVAIVISASLSAHIAGMFLNGPIASLVATACLWPLILLFAEFIPMSLALAYSLKISLWGAPLLKLMYVVCYPFIGLVTCFSKWINTWVGGKSDLKGPYFTRDELRLLFTRAEKDVFEKGETRLIHGVFDFHKIRVHQIMVPLKNVVAASSRLTVGEIKKTIFDSAFSRIPIFERYPSYMIGTIHAMDLIGLDDDVGVEGIVRPSFKVSVSRPVAEVLSEMGSREVHMAIVMDERDRCVGLVTMEDVLEEIVGEIEDEYDKENNDQIPSSNNQTNSKFQKQSFKENVWNFRI